MSTVSPEQLVTPRYCQVCGSPLIERYFDYEARTRLQCDGCGFVHYLNPRVVTAVIIEYGGRVLLQRRAMEPGRGLWTFPGGFLEVGERPEEGAVREAKEEVGLEVELAGLHGVYSRPHIGIVLVVYAGTSASGAAVVGDYESTEVAWFGAEAIPWDDLAFDTTRGALQDWVRRRNGA